VKTINIEQATLDACVHDAQQERVVITRNGVPVALMVGVEGLDEEQLGLSSSREFWDLIAERRRQPTLTRSELEQRLSSSGK
jgi:antitoxin (DNA-binding transcriptional repressor) of toxin-antitoxin stability system